MRQKETNPENDFDFDNDDLPDDGFDFNEDDDDPDIDEYGFRLIIK